MPSTYSGHVYVPSRRTMNACHGPLFTSCGVFVAQDLQRTEAPRRARGRVPWFQRVDRVSEWVALLSQQPGALDRVAPFIDTCASLLCVGAPRGLYAHQFPATSGRRQFTDLPASVFAPLATTISSMCVARGGGRSIGSVVTDLRPRTCTPRSSVYGYHGTSLPNGIFQVCLRVHACLVHAAICGWSTHLRRWRVWT